MKEQRLTMVLGIMGVVMLLTIQLTYGQTFDSSSTRGTGTTENSPSQTWIKHYDFNDADRLKEIRPTADGGILLLGKRGVYPEDGDEFWWQMKIDTMGDIVWARGLGEYEILETIQPTEDGGHIAAGRQGVASYMAKYDSEGNQVWINEYESITNSYTYINAIHPTSDGGYIVAGASYSSCTPWSGCLQRESWVMKLNEDGQMIWAKSYDSVTNWVGAQDDGIYETADNGYIILGPFNNLVVKLEADGAIAWAKTYNHGYISSIQPADDGSYLVAGVVSTTTGPACWVMKLYADGSLAWERAYRQDDFQGNLYVSVQQAADGNYALLCSEGENYTLLRLDADGELIGQRQYGEGLVVDSSTSLYLQLADDGNLLVGGTITHSLGFGDQDVAVWKLKVDGTVCQCPWGQEGNLEVVTNLEEVLIYSVLVQVAGDPNVIVRSRSATVESDLVGNVFTVCLTEIQDEVTGLITTEGGSLTASDGQTQFLFPAGVFSDTVRVTYRHFWDDLAVGDLAGIGERVEVTAVYSTTQQPAQLMRGAVFTVTIHYTDNSPAIEETLAWYQWQDTAWQRVDTSQLSLDDRVITADLGDLGQFAILGETYHFYLPAVLQNANHQGYRLRLDLDQTGNNFVDWSGYGHDGWCASSSCPALVTGIDDAARHFDGINHFIQLGNPQTLNFAGKVTIAAWVKAEATNGLRNITAHGFTLNPAAELFLRINNGLYEVGSWDGSDHKTSFAMPAGDLGQWVHLVGVYDGTAWRLYRNGVEVSSAADATGAVFVHGRWAVGANGEGDGRFFQGSIDEVLIYDHGLTAAKVAELYQSYLSQ